MKRTFMLMLIMAMALGAVACAGAAPKPEETLGYNVHMYHQHLRWGRYYEASLFLNDADREHFMGRQEELGDDWRVVEVEVRSIRMTKPNEEAQAEVVIAWTRSPDVTVHKDKVIEVWRLVAGRWQIVEREVEPL